jgi:hypothetical protein
MEEQKELINIIVDDDDETKSDSSKDVGRVEMPWTNRQEQYFSRVLKECTEKQQAHDKQAHIFKKKYVHLSIPAIIIPLIFASINEFLKDNFNYINTSAMMLAGVISGINSFFNFGAKYQKHNAYAGKYDELAGEIEVLLSTNRQFRIPCDVALERIKTRFNNLNNNAPMI